MTGCHQCDVLVIGLGGSGLTAIHTLLKQKPQLKVIGIDGANIVGSGASGRNGGFLLAGFDEFYHEDCERMGRDKCKARYLETIDELEYQLKEFPECCTQTGSLRIAEDDVELDGC